MKNLVIILHLLLLGGCKKDAAISVPGIPPAETIPGEFFTKYSIFKGAHYCDKTSIKAFEGDQVNFKIKFDSTAIYQTIDPANQLDINKLIGFSEGSNNHINSARLGWSWNEGALRLYGYVYANGVRISREIAVVDIGTTIRVGIRISGKEYIFSVNEKKLVLPRGLETESVSGYWQFPYFGGDEVAPHDMYIKLLHLKN
ncbi:MAG: hypothetical protein H7X88_07760 [Gloeobacteraceae cyanobacterium ES-bin-316]|nr:hypothetical protein [Ferruginibacter sp.]